MNLSLPADRAPLALGIPIQPLTGLPLQPGERVILRAHPVTGEPLADDEEPTVEERWAALVPSHIPKHPTITRLLNATPLDADLIILVAGLFSRPALNPNIYGTYDALERNPTAIAYHQQMIAQHALAACQQPLPERIWQALADYGVHGTRRALMANLHCPEHIRVRVALT